MCYSVNNLCLQLLYPEDESNHGRQDKVPLVGNQRKYHDLVNNAREHLASRQGDIIAKRGVRLIDTMLSVGGLTGHDHTPVFTSMGQNSRRGSTSGVRMDLQTIVAQFLAGDAVQMGASEETWRPASNAESPLDLDPVGVDFDTWFEGLFGT